MNLDLNEYGMIGDSKQIREVYKRISMYSGLGLPVTIWGETGTGKELAASAVHKHSNLNSDRFIAVNCAAITETLFESEVFGHVKGAFTGADSNKIGYAKKAGRGTLFLDEILYLPKSSQEKILRMIETSQFYPVGSTEPEETLARIIVSSPQNLEEEIEKGTFNEALYYRLNQLPIYMPPLRERGQDIEKLARYFLHQRVVEYRKNVDMTREAVEYIMKQEWPGNVRELKNKMTQAFILAKHSDDRTISKPMLKEIANYGKNGTSKKRRGPPNIKEQVWAMVQEKGLRSVLDEFDEYFTNRALEQTKSSRLAAKILGITVQQYKNRLNKYHLQ